MYYVAMKQDWESDGIIFDRPHYFFETKEEAENYLIRKEFYLDTNNSSRYILEIGYSVLFAKIVELTKWEPKEDIEEEPVEETPEEEPKILILEENKYSVVAKFIGYSRKPAVRMKKRTIDGILYACHPDMTVPISQWSYSVLYKK